MSPVEHDAVLKDHLVRLLTTAWAHPTFEDAVRDLPPEHHGARQDGFEHTPWQLLEHLRICQRDLLEYSRSAGSVSRTFPDDYWPGGEQPPDDGAWQKSVDSFRADLGEMKTFISDPATDLVAPLPWSEEGHTVLREALILADHAAYHVGQLVQLRRALGCWPRS